MSNDKMRAAFEAWADTNGFVKYRESMFAAWQAALAAQAQEAPSEPVGVHVCPARDIECGSNPTAWCASCPKRPAPASAQAAVPEGWQQDLIQLLISIRPSFGDFGSRDVDVKVRQQQIDAAIAMIAAAPDAPAAVPEQRNIREIRSTSDQSVEITFASCRAAEAFKRAAAPSTQQGDGE